MSEETILQKMEKTSSQYEVVKLRAEQELADEVRRFINGEIDDQGNGVAEDKQKRIRGVYLVTDSKRYYPYSTLASQAIARPTGMPADNLMEISGQAAELRGRTVAVVTSAEALSEQQTTDLGGRLRSIYGREIAVHNEIDPTLMGGVVVRVGDEIIDGSVAGRLDALRRSLR